jgi:2-polyprenyl-6-methoxyphenol hydroxylase-like FAD-dependent oxidoreductase
MERSLDIAIVGYGIAGIATAIHLRRAGHRIRHFERNDQPAAGGAGMLLHPAAMRQLEKLGVLAAAIERGAAVRHICAQTSRGQPLIDFGYGDVIGDKHALGIQRGTLHRLLSNADPGRDEVVAGCKVVSVDPETGYLVEEHGARHGPFDLIVVADGTYSLLRKQVTRCSQQEADSAALVGLLDDPQGFAGDSLVQYFDSTRHLSIWPVGCAFVGDTARCAIAISVTPPEAETFRDQGRWRTLVTQLCPDLRALVSAESTSLRAFTYRDVELSQPCAGRIAIIGDAAHSMSPQLGTGAQLAMEDAATLASVLEVHNNVPDALRAFMRIRLPELRRHHLASRWLTPLFQTESRALAFLRDRVFASGLSSVSARQMAQSLFC